MSEYTYKGRDIESVLMSGYDFLKLKLTGYFRDLNGRLLVYYCPTSVILMLDNSYIQFTVIQKDGNSYLRIDSFQKDLILDVVDRKPIKFDYEYLLSYPTDFLKLFYHINDKFWDCEFKGESYKVFYKDFFNVQSYPDLVIRPFTDKDSYKLANYEYDGVLSDISVYGFCEKFEAISFSGAYNLKFSFNEDCIFNGEKDFVTSLVNQFRDFRRHIPELTFDLCVMKGISGDSVVVFNKHHFVQFRVVEHKDQKALRIDTSFRDLLVRHLDGSIYLNNAYLFTKYDIPYIEIDFVNSLDQSRGIPVTYKGIDYLLWSSKDLNLEYNEYGNTCVDIRVTTSCNTYNYDEYWLSLFINNGKFNHLDLHDFKACYTFYTKDCMMVYKLHGIDR